MRRQASGLIKKRPQWWRNLNKGLLAEFIIFILSQGFDFFTNCSVLFQITGVLDKAKFYKDFPNVTSLSYPVHGTCQTIEWSREQIDAQVKHFNDVTIVYCLFIALTSLFMTLHLISWLYTLFLSAERRELGEQGRTVLVRMKLVFLGAASLLEDIPLSSLTAELFAVQQGSRGLVCWLCKVSAGSCLDETTLESSLNASQQVLILNVCAISVTSLWKGISTFYRWSRFPNCEAFLLRALTSVFAGGLFVLMILTPAMTVLSYRYFVLPGVSGGLVKDLIDKVYTIGVILWMMIMAILCCCPLLFLIRVGDK